MRNQRSAFTLVELLVVIGIIVLLIGILIPVVGRVRLSAQEADSRQQIAGLSAAIERYYNDFKAYPGVFDNRLVRNDLADASDFGGPGGTFIVDAPNNSNYDETVGALYTKLTGSENLTLALLGGLRLGTGSAPGALQLIYDPADVGKGPISLNTASPKRFAPYTDAKDLSWRTVNGRETGLYSDGTVDADDTLIPEFVDRFSAGGLPILYLRARPGAPGIVDEEPGPNSPNVSRQYNIRHILGYTRNQSGSASDPRYIGVGRSVPTGSNLTGIDRRVPPHGLRELTTGTIYGFNEPNVANNPKPPYALDVYLANPNANGNTFTRATGVPRQKDGYILISAGRDRVYGTNDDITNFGAVR